MTRRLEQGRYFGRTVVRREMRGLLLTETAHAARDRIPAHRHVRPYFCYVLEGGFAESSGRRTRAIGPAALVYHPPDEVHDDRFGPAGGRCLNIELGPGWEGPAGAGGGPAVVDADRAALAGRIHAELARPDDLSPLAIEGLVTALLAEAGRAMAPERRRPAWLDRVVDLLHARHAEPLSLAALAAEAGVSPGRVAPEFRRHLGLTPAEYVRRLRVEIARRRLLETGDGIARIAIAVGFADHAHFTRTFRRLTGTTPSRWRRDRGAPPARD